MPSWSVVERDAPTPDRGQLLIEATRCYQNLADTMRRIPLWVERERRVRQPR
jgi:hypothetical protein